MVQMWWFLPQVYFAVKYEGMASMGLDKLSTHTLVRARKETQRERRG